MLNVRAGDLQAVLGLLPALQRPTISPLTTTVGGGHTIIEESTVRDLTPAAQSGAAEEIVEYPSTRSCCDGHAPCAQPALNRREIRIVRATSAGAVSALLDRRRPGIRPSTGPWRRSSAASGATATARSSTTPGGSNKLRDRSKSTAGNARSARDVPAAVKRAIRTAARAYPMVAARQLPRSWSVSPERSAHFQRVVRSTASAAMSRAGGIRLPSRCG